MYGPSVRGNPTLPVRCYPLNHGCRTADGDGMCHLGRAVHGTCRLGTRTGGTQPCTHQGPEIPRYDRFDRSGHPCLLRAFLPVPAGFSRVYTLFTPFCSFWPKYHGVRHRTQPLVLGVRGPRCPWSLVSGVLGHRCSVSGVRGHRCPWSSVSVVGCVGTP